MPEKIGPLLLRVEARDSRAIGGISTTRFEAFVFRGTSSPLRLNCLTSLRVEARKSISSHFKPRSSPTLKPVKTAKKKSGPGSDARIWRTSSRVRGVSSLGSYLGEEASSAGLKGISRHLTACLKA